MSSIIQTLREYIASVTMTDNDTMTMITDLLNINVAINCYERAQALHAI